MHSEEEDEEEEEGEAAFKRSQINSLPPHVVPILPNPYPPPKWGVSSALSCDFEQVLRLLSQGLGVQVSKSRGIARRTRG